MKTGDNVWLGNDLGRIVAEEGKVGGERIFRVRFDSPEQVVPSEGLYKESELELA